MAGEGKKAWKQVPRQQHQLTRKLLVVKERRMSWLQAKNSKQIPESDITVGRENTVTGRSDLSVKGPDKEVTDGAEETQDMEAGAKTAAAVNNEVNHGVGEKKVMVASEKALQATESEFASAIDMDVAKKEYKYRCK